MNEAPVYSNLEHCRQMMASKSTSDFREVIGGHGNMIAIAEGALYYAKRNAPDDIDKLMYGYLIDLYIDLISQKDKLRFLNRCHRYAEAMIDKRGMRKKRAGQIVDVAIHCLTKKNLTNAERARMMRVNQDNYCKRYRDCVDDLLGVFYENLAIADSLVKDGLED